MKGQEPHGKSGYSELWEITGVHFKNQEHIRACLGVILTSGHGSGVIDGKLRLLFDERRPRVVLPPPPLVPLIVRRENLMVSS